MPDAFALISAVSYCGPAPLPADLLARWNFDPGLLAALVAGIGWTLSVERRRRSAAQGSGERAAPSRAFMAAMAAMAVLAVAFISPLCAATVALFSARAVHHVLLVAVAAPLFALAGVFARNHRATHPAGLPLAVAMGVFYAWHLPPLYAAALGSTAVYWAMQVSLLASATWFWAAVLNPRTALPHALLAIIATAALMGLLGALLTFAPQPLYAPHAIAPYAFGLTPLDDQRLAGLVMWVPALLPYLVFAAIAARRGAGAWARSAA